MKTEDLDSALRELSARRIDTPDVTARVRYAIAGRRAVAGLSSNALPLRILFPASLAMAVLIGIAISAGGVRAPLKNNLQAEAAQTLHLDIFHTAGAGQTIEPLFR